MTNEDDFHDARNIRRDIEVIFLTGLLPQCIIGIVTDYSMIDDEFLVRIHAHEYDDNKIVDIRISNPGIIKRCYNILVNEFELTGIKVNSQPPFGISHKSRKTVVYLFNFYSDWTRPYNIRYWPYWIWWDVSNIFKYLACGYIDPKLKQGIKLSLERFILNVDERDRIARRVVSTVIDSFIWPRVATS